MAGLLGLALGGGPRPYRADAMPEVDALAGVAGSGPWLLPVAGMLLLALLTLTMPLPDALLTPFQAAVSHLTASSLVLTGPMQFHCLRFAADRLRERRGDLLLPNFHAMVLVTTLLAGLVGLVAVLWLLPRQSPLCRLLMLANFVLMCDGWVAAAFLSARKAPRAAVTVTLPSYAVAWSAGLALSPFGLEGLLGGLALGQLVLLTGMSARIYGSMDGRRFVSFEAFRRGHAYPSLLAIGLFYGVGIWADTLLFRYAATTGQPALGVLHASAVHDAPALLGYLTIVPAVLVYLLRIEPDQTAHYDAFRHAVRGGGSLRDIEAAADGLVRTIRLGLYEIVKVQAMASLALAALVRPLLAVFGLPQVSLPLLYAQAVAAGLHLLLLAVLNVHCRLDRRREVLLLCAALAVLNLALSGVTLWLGAAWYGWGFAASLAIVTVAGMMLLNRRLERLEYETYMLQ